METTRDIELLNGRLEDQLPVAIKLVTASLGISIILTGLVFSFVLVSMLFFVETIPVGVLFVFLGLTLFGVFVFVGSVLSLEEPFSTLKLIFFSYWSSES